VDLPTAIEKHWAQLTVAAGAIFTAFKFWSDQRAKRRETAAATFAARAVAKLDLTKLAQEAAADVIQTLREEVDHWTGEVGKLRGELRELQSEHIRMIADKDAEIALLRGRNRQHLAEIETLHRAMQAAGIPIPKPTPYFEVPRGSSQDVYLPGQSPIPTSEGSSS
jgi:hypothetical protein